MNTILLSNNDRTFADALIGTESLTINEPLCSEKTLRFGSCEVSKIQLRVRTSDAMIGERYNLRLNDGIVRIWNGLTVIGDKPTADKCYRDITLVDKMYDIINADVSEWYNSILPNQDSVVTLNAFRNSFCQHFGIEQEPVVLANDLMLVRRTVDPEQMTGKRVLHDICEINGCFAKVTRAGKLRYIFLAPYDSEMQFRELAVRSATNEDFDTDPITKVQIRSTETDVGAIYGDGDNCYVIQDNFLLYGCTPAELQMVAEKLYEIISRITYMPANIVTTADVDMEVGEMIRVESNHRTIYTYVLERTLKGIQSIKDTIVAKGTQKQAEKVSSVNDSLIQLRGKTNRLERDVEGNRILIEDVDKGLRTSISNTAAEFNMQISEIQKEIDGSLVVFNGEGDPLLTNWPAWDWSETIPCNDTIQASDDLCLEYKDEYWKKHARTLFFDETSGVTYRFEKRNDIWNWYPTSDTEYGYLLEKIAEIDIKSDNISLQVSELEKNVTENYVTEISAGAMINVSKSEIMQNVYSEYVTKTGAENRYENKVHSEALFKMASDKIDLETSRAVNNEREMSAGIYMNTQSIRAEAQRAAGEEGKLSAAIQVAAGDILLEAQRATEAEGTLSGKLDVADREIKAKVSQTGGDASSFGWSLTSGGFSLFSGGKTVFKANSQGIIVDGYAEAKELRAATGRIDAIESNYISATQADFKYATITELNTEKGRINNLESDHVATMDFEAAVGRIDTIQSDYVKTARISAVEGDITDLKSDYAEISKAVISKADIKDLTAATGRITTLEGNHVSVKDFNAQKARIDNLAATKISADYINATNICGVLNSPTANTNIAIGSVSTSAFYYYSGAGYESLYPMNVTINGKVYRLFGHV